KPLDGTYAQNAEKWGVAGLNIDGARIGTNAGWSYPNGRGGKGWMDKKSLSKNLDIPVTATKGRWPANLILDEEAGKMLDEQSGESRSGKGTGLTPTPARSSMNASVAGINRVGYNDRGGASRFFYCAKASKAERNIGLSGEKKIVDDGRGKKIDNPYLRGKTLKQNTHPTVKPLALMEYLCTLTATPTGGIVLDPFMGSGTTGMAAKKTNRGFIGIEVDKEYFQIAVARIKAIGKEAK
ncbi:MAG: DNA methyltransferase, partial [Candidatus Helarchaeota archaeon]